MDKICMETERCIVTGEPAHCWSGHLVAKANGAIRDDGTMPIFTVAVVAGFKDHETSKLVQSNGNGCLGEWKPEYGVRLSS